MDQLNAAGADTGDRGRAQLGATTGDPTYHLDLVGAHVRSDGTDGLNHFHRSITLKAEDAIVELQRYTVFPTSLRSRQGQDASGGVVKA